MSKDEETKRKRASRQEAGALGKRDAYMYDPETLVLVTDEKSPLYDERVHLPVNEKLVANIKFQPDGPDGAPLGSSSRSSCGETRRPARSRWSTVASA